MGGLQFSSRDISLGRQYAGASCEFELGLQNLSASTVEIAEVVSGCLCTTARVEPSILPRGGHGRLVGKVTFPSRAGQYREQVAIVMRSGVTHVVRVSAVTVAPLTVVPARIDLGSIRLGGKAEAKTEIRIDADALSGQRLRILPGSGGPGLTARLVHKRDRTWVLETALEAQEPGRVRQRIAIGLPQRKEPLAVVPIVARVPPPVSVRPARLYLGTVHRGREMAFELNLEWNYDETELLAASADVVSCKILPETALPGRPAKLQVSLSFSDGLGLVKGHLLIETRNPDWKVAVPIVAFVEEASDP